MTDIAIQLEGVSLDYPKHKSGGGLLREVLTGRFRKTRDAAAWHRAIDQLDLTVNRGEVVGVMGPNGSGKSTLAYTLLAHPKYEVVSGDILLDGESILELTADERSKKGLFLGFQYPREVSGVGFSHFL